LATTKNMTTERDLKKTQEHCVVSPIVGVFIVRRDNKRFPSSISPLLEFFWLVA
jgi:hypothetical protein